MPQSTAENLTPTQRRYEVAVILGRGMLRFCNACTNTPDACGHAPETTEQKALDVSAPGDPHVSW
jgi:hypothetical protein